MIRVLFIGDVFGSPGRRCVEKLAPALRRELELDLVVANGENAAGGVGINARLASELFLAGVDVITTGNHVWRHRDLIPLLDQEPHLLRPANYPPGAPGNGWVKVQTRDGVGLVVLNLEGRTFMSHLDCPFRQAGALLQGPLKDEHLVLVDMHAEASSEKQAMGWHLDGRVSAVIGTHTHAMTADERILPGGTAFITDAGFTGPHESVIGMEPQVAIARFLTMRHQTFKVAKGDPRLQGVLLVLDPATGKAASIERIDRRL